MKVRQHHWWIIGGLGLLLCVGSILAVYRFGWSATGFLKKSLWDWLQLLIVPLMLAVVALVFQLTNTRTERQIAKQRYEHDQQIADQRYEHDQQIALEKQREELLQAYLDRMSELLLEKDLRTSPTGEVCNVARVRTITILNQLDGRRISYVFAFLREAGLMSVQQNRSAVDLSEADFSNVIWHRADLKGACLSGADLYKADLSGANLSGADLSGANLKEADLSGANLYKANLKEAYLYKANLQGVGLSGANLTNAYLGEANMYRANLYEAIIDNTIFSEEQLAQVKIP